VSRSIFALITDQDRQFFGQETNRVDQIGYIESDKRAIFGRSYAGEPDQLIRELARDEAIQEADTILLTIPNTLGVDYNVHVLSSILKHVAPGMGWR
jgi:alkanesulfonate monooxygenase SsuD/methylene tetrahydromethanopterin reductase-like flavin-dependent oxidoreductase (luciferase family)